MEFKKDPVEKYYDIGEELGRYFHLNFQPFKSKQGKHIQFFTTSAMQFQSESKSRSMIYTNFYEIFSLFLNSNSHIDTV